MSFFLQKLHTRQSLLAKTNLSGKEKEKWSKILVNEMMSSEESDEETIFIKELPWRSSKVDSFFHALDEEAMKKSLSRQNAKQRIGFFLNNCNPQDLSHLSHFPLGP